MRLITVLRKWVVPPRSDEPPVQGRRWLEPFHIHQKGRKRNRSRRGRESAKTRSAWVSERPALDLRVSVWRQTDREKEISGGSGCGRSRVEIMRGYKFHIT